MATKLVTYDILRGYLGADVARLQRTLNDTQGAGLTVDGVYGGMTDKAIRALQAKSGLPVDGQCSGDTLTKVRNLGFKAIEFAVGNGNESINWPAKPAASVLTQPNAAITGGLFGTFDFVGAPTADNPQRIQIKNNWVANNIVTVTVPQLVGVPIPISDAHARLSDGRVQCHTLAKDKILALFAAWEAAGLTDRILTWYGSFNPRLKRGHHIARPENLSNHSWGSAFDINAPQNWLGHTPAAMGQRGCVRELAVIAASMGVYWGGHFGPPTHSKSRDGMHFEIAKL